MIVVLFDSCIIPLGGSRQMNVAIQSFRQQGLCSQSEKRSIADFYASVDYEYCPIDNDQLTVAYIFTDRAEMSKGQVVGAAYLREENGTLVLRGMQVLPEYQRQEIGSKIVGWFFSPSTNFPCYCIAHDHLEQFYGKFGFKKIPEHRAPNFLQIRIADYREKFPESSFIIMRRN